MNSHKNALLTAKGREPMVRAVLDKGLSLAAVARLYRTTPKTVGKWVARCYSSRPKQLATSLGRIACTAGGTDSGRRAHSCHCVEIRGCRMAISAQSVILAR
jgi:hypothetical protein